MILNCSKSRWMIDWTTMRLFVFADAACNGTAQRVANTLNRNPIEDLLEEACHNCPNGLFSRESAALRVEDQFFVDST